MERRTYKTASSSGPGIVCYDTDCADAPEAEVSVEFLDMAGGIHKPPKLADGFVGDKWRRRNLLSLFINYAVHGSSRINHNS
jgi:hypothetical protein